MPLQILFEVQFNLCHYQFFLKFKYFSSINQNFLDHGCESISGNQISKEKLKNEVPLVENTP